MYSSPKKTLAALGSVGYFTDLKTATTVYLAGMIHRPIMLEGPAGAGKTELAASVARAYGVRLIRLQCYQGINEEKAIGQYDRSLQELYVLLMSRSERTPDWAEIKREVSSRSYFMAGALLEAIEQEQRCVLLIDEIDKVDHAFEAQAFKRACSCFGLGRYFYDFAEMWVELNEHKQPKSIPTLPSWALPKGHKAANPPQMSETSCKESKTRLSVQKGPLDASVTTKIESFRRELGDALFRSILAMAHARSAREIPNQHVQQNVLKWMESGARGMARVREIAAELPETKFYAILDDQGVESLTKVPNFGVLEKLVNAMTQAAQQLSVA
jgi:hypothetical protein